MDKKGKYWTEMEYFSWGLSAVMSGAIKRFRLYRGDKCVLDVDAITSKEVIRHG